MSTTTRRCLQAQDFPAHHTRWPVGEETIARTQRALGRRVSSSSSSNKSRICWSDQSMASLKLNLRPWSEYQLAKAPGVTLQGSRTKLLISRTRSAVDAASVSFPRTAQSSLAKARTHLRADSCAARGLYSSPVARADWSYLGSRHRSLERSSANCRGIKKTKFERVR